jgi:WD40 repeat protein
VQAITEIILCATIPSPDVYSTVLEALMRVGVPSHTKIVKSVVWLPGTHNVVSASLDGTFKVWNTEYGEYIVFECK